MVRTIRLDDRMVQVMMICCTMRLDEDLSDSEELHQTFREVDFLQAAVFKANSVCRPTSDKIFRYCAGRSC